jgi:hypothetical protein
MIKDLRELPLFSCYGYASMLHRMVRTRVYDFPPVSGKRVTWPRFCIPNREEEQSLTGIKVTLVKENRHKVSG